jgi:hypothetical protein
MSCPLISFDTFVGLALETTSTSPYRDGNTGSVGSNGASSPTIYLPLAGDESLSSQPNFQELNQPDGDLSNTKYQSLATKAEGSIPLLLPPGIMAILKQWLWTRGTSTYVGTCENELPSCTVWINLGGVTCRRFVGVKVNTAEFTIPKEQPVQLNLNCVGYGEELVSPISFSAPSWWHDAVYGGDSVAVQIPSGTTQRDTDSVRFSINNKLDDSPHRLWISNYPRRMWNRDREVTGNFEKDFVDTTEYAKFLAGTTGSLVTTLSKTISSTTYTETFTFPRIRHNAISGLNAGSQKDRIVKESSDWKALRSTDGTAELVWGSA